MELWRERSLYNRILH